MNQDKVKYMHFRAYDDRGQLRPFGGMTVAYAPQLDHTIFAVAMCHPNDRYVKQYGRAKALGRLSTQDYSHVVAMDVQQFAAQMYAEPESIAPFDKLLRV